MVSFFIKRHAIYFKSARVIDTARFKYLSSPHVAEKIARVCESIRRYKIRDDRFIFNMDRYGKYFEKILGKIFRMVLAALDMKIIRSAVRKKDNLKRITVQVIASTAGVT